MLPAPANLGLKRNGVSVQSRFTKLVALYVTLAGSLFAQSAKTVEPTDILDLRTVSDAQIAPDGTRSVYVVTTPSKGTAKPTSHIWLSNTSGQANQTPLILSGGSDSAPRWSPDGRSIAFLSTRPNPLRHDGLTTWHFTVAPGSIATDSTAPRQDDAAEPESQIWLLPMQGGEAQPLTDIRGGVKSFKWMPDGQSIAFLRRDPEPEQEEERKKKKKDWNIALENHVFDRLWIYTLATQQARLVTPQDVNVDDFTPSPDGTKFVVKTSPTPYLNDFYYVTRTSIIDAASGQELKSLTEHGSFTGDWSPDGQHLVLQERIKPQHTDVGIALFPFLYNLQTGKQTPITTSIPSTLESVGWSTDGKSLSALSDENTHVVLQSISLETGAARTVQNLGAVSGHPSVSKDGETMAYICSRPDHPGELCILRDRRATVLTEFNPQVKDWALGRSEEVAWKSSRDGLELHGVLVYPAHYTAGQRYRTILHIHGGPTENWLNGWNGSWYDPAQYYASHGFVVFLPMIRGSSGSGPEFENLTLKNWGDADFQDALDGLDTLVHRGITDPDRLVIGGWSYGGYTTAWGITHSHRFKAAVVGAGISDLFSMALTTDIAPSYLDDYFGPVIPNRKLYDTHSAISYLDQVTTPTLILHGEADLRVPVSQSHELFNGLRFLGKDAQMVTYPREPHIFTEREHQVDSLTRMLNWYDSHVPETK